MNEKVANSLSLITTPKRPTGMEGAGVKYSAPIPKKSVDFFARCGFIELKNIAGELAFSNKGEGRFFLRFGDNRINNELSQAPNGPVRIENIYDPNEAPGPIEGLSLRLSPHESLENLSDYLSENGIEHSSQNGYSESLDVTDPEGNAIEILSDRASEGTPLITLTREGVEVKDSGLEKADHIALETVDIKKMEAFYDHLGFDVVATPDNVAGTWLYSQKDKAPLEPVETGFGIHLMDRKFITTQEDGTVTIPEEELLDPTLRGPMLGLQAVNTPHVSLGQKTDDLGQGRLNLLNRGGEQVEQQFFFGPAGQRIEVIQESEIQRLVSEQLLPIQDLKNSASPEVAAQIEQAKKEGAELSELEDILSNVDITDSDVLAIDSVSTLTASSFDDVTITDSSDSLALQDSGSAKGNIKARSFATGSLVEQTPQDETITRVKAKSLAKGIVDAHGLVLLDDEI